MSNLDICELHICLCWPVNKCSWRLINFLNMVKYNIASHDPVKNNNNLMPYNGSVAAWLIWDSMRGLYTAEKYTKITVDLPFPDFVMHDEFY